MDLDSCAFGFNDLLSVAFFSEQDFDGACIVCDNASSDKHLLSVKRDSAYC